MALLRGAIGKEPESPDAYTQLAMAFGRKGDLAEADLASALAAVMRGDARTARDLATRAKTRFPVGSPGWVKADDIISSQSQSQLTREGPLMTSLLRLFAATAAFLLAVLVLPAAAQSISPAQRNEIEGIVKDYLVKNPEVLQEAYMRIGEAPGRRRGRQASKRGEGSRGGAV